MALPTNSTLVQDMATDPYTGASSSTVRTLFLSSAVVACPVSNSSSSPFCSICWRRRSTAPRWRYRRHDILHALLAFHCIGLDCRQAFTCVCWYITGQPPMPNRAVRCGPYSFNPFLLHCLPVAAQRLVVGAVEVAALGLGCLHTVAKSLVIV